MVTKNEVYTKLTEYLSGVYCTQYYEPIPKELPCVYFRESHSRIARYVTLEMDDEQLRMICYVEVYGQEIDEIVEKVEKAFRDMNFIEELNEMIPNYNPTIERVSMRFQRIITGGSTL